MFTSTIEEAQVWVRVLSLICEMNQKNIDVEQVNPFDYEKVKLMLEESKHPTLQTIVLP